MRLLFLSLRRAVEGDRLESAYLQLHQLEGRLQNLLGRLR